MKVADNRVEQANFFLGVCSCMHKHLDYIDAKYDSLIHGKIKEQLTHEPEARTRNRKPLRSPAAFHAEWELRFGPDNQFRVFYQVDRESLEVKIVAIGVKHRNRLLVGGQEIKP